MVKHKFILTAAFIIATGVIGCAQQESEDTMTIGELQEAIKTDSSLVIVDVRTPHELSGPLGIIDGVINIPVQELDRRLNELEQYKDNNIAVICKIGYRSGIATKILLENGYKAKNVLGGMTEYRQSEK